MDGSAGSPIGRSGLASRAGPETDGPGGRKVIGEGLLPSSVKFADARQRAAGYKMSK